MVSTGKLKKMMDDLRSQIEQLDEICLNDRQLSIRQEVFNRVLSREPGDAGRGSFWDRRGIARVMAVLRCRKATGTRTRIDGSQVSGRTQQPGKNRLPRQHEPRNPHADERHSRFQRIAARRFARTEAPAISAIHPLQRRFVAAAHQRHSRHVKNRGGRDGIASRTDRPARDLRFHPHAVFRTGGQKRTQTGMSCRREFSARGVD